MNHDQVKACRAALDIGIAELALEVSDGQRQQLLQYLAQLIKWNRAYNLTAIRDPLAMVEKHLLDSLSVVTEARLKAPGIWADIGTGAGLPGIPLAILAPAHRYHLVDSAGKKTRFLQQVVMALGLQDRVSVHHQRIEVLHLEISADVIISRAFASLDDMIEVSEHLLSSSGEWWAMKGHKPEDELSALAKHYKVVRCSTLKVPASLGARCLVTLQRDVGAQKNA